MSDPGVREIQLSGKQLVFLFMASVIVAVGIFLLGVSVGRGVRTAEIGETEPAQVADAEGLVPPGEMPPPTETTPVDLSYHDQLQGQVTPPARPVEPPPPPVEPVVEQRPATPERRETPEPPAASATPPAAARPQTPAPAPAPARPAATTPAPAAATAGRSATPSGSWTVQVGAFRSRENADRQVAQLKGQGFPAYSDAAAPGGLVKVFVGPFQDRAAADRMAGRLQREQGLRPLVTR